jgi:ATP phosphoribosyltransferase
VLRIVLPKGSLERATLELFRDADLEVIRASEVEYRAFIQDPRVSEVRILRPQEIPLYVAEGIFDLGITGRDWIEETGAEVVSVGVLAYSKNTANPIRIVLAVAEESPWRQPTDLPDGVRVSTEYPRLAERYFARLGKRADIHLSYGATEGKVPEIADAVIEATETGRALKAAGLKVIDTVLESYTELISNESCLADPEKKKAVDQIKVLIEGAMAARGRVLVKLNVDEQNLDAVLAALPALKSPTVSPLRQEGAFAVEAVVDKASINLLIPELKERGATDILEIPLTKIVR